MPVRPRLAARRAVTLDDERHPHRGRGQARPPAGRYTKQKRKHRTVNFHIDDEEIDYATHVIELGGEVDLYTAPEFKERMVELIESGKKHFVVDLSQATSYDEDSVGALVRVLRLRPEGGSLTLVCRDENITKIFETTGLDRIFPIYPSRADALAALEVDEQEAADAQRVAAEREAPVAHQETEPARREGAVRKAERVSARRREAEEFWGRYNRDPPSRVSRSALRRESEVYWDRFDWAPPSRVKLTVDQLRDLIHLHGWSVHWDLGADYPMDPCQTLLIDDDGRILASVGGWSVDQDDLLPYWDVGTAHGPGTWEERRQAQRVDEAQILADLFRQGIIAERERLARPWWRRRS
jgi:anti-sigma B factor antagonist